MSNRRATTTGDLGDQLRQWMATEAGDAPAGLVDDTMDAVVSVRSVGGVQWRRSRVLTGIARYAALTAAVAAGVALGIWISSASLRLEPPVGASPQPVPTAPSGGPGMPLALGPLRADLSVTISGRAPAIGPSGLWYEAADGAGIGLLRGGAGQPVVFGLWEPDPGAGPRIGNLVEAFGSVWVADTVAGELLRVSPSNGEIAARFALGPGHVAAGTGSIWFLSAIGLERIDPGSNQAATAVSGVGSADGSVAVQGGSILVANGDQVIQIDETTEQIIQRLDLHARRLVVGDGAIWGITPREVIRYDPASDELTRRLYGNIDTPMEEAVDLAWAGDRLLLVITDRGNEDIVQVAHPSWSVLERTSFARRIDGLAVGYDALWVATDPDGRIWRMVVPES